MKKYPQAFEDEIPELQKKIDLKNERPVCVYSHDNTLNDFFHETTTFDDFKVLFLSGGKISHEK